MIMFDEGFGFDSYMIGAPLLVVKTRKHPEVNRLSSKAPAIRERQFCWATGYRCRGIPVGQKRSWFRSRGPTWIHSWQWPAFGVKARTLYPGRLAETWFSPPEKEGPCTFGQVLRIVRQRPHA